MRESQEQIPVCVTPLGPRQTQKPRRADVLPVGYFDSAEETATMAARVSALTPEGVTI